MQQNEELAEKFGEDALRRNIKILTKRKCRNQYRNNWILEATPDIASHILKQGKININLTKTYVIEAFNVPICFNCSMFNHLAKNCNEKPVCHVCGKREQHLNCEKTLNCINCQRLGIQERKHSARDKNCPCYARKVEQMKKYTNYKGS